jgi:hypothetical protein
MSKGSDAAREQREDGRLVVDDQHRLLSGVDEASVRRSGVVMTRKAPVPCPELSTNDLHAATLSHAVCEEMRAQRMEYIGGGI